MGRMESMKGIHCRRIGSLAYLRQVCLIVFAEDRFPRFLTFENMTHQEAGFGDYRGIMMRFLHTGTTAEIINRVLYRADMELYVDVGDMMISPCRRKKFGSSVLSDRSCEFRVRLGNVNRY
jgi:hypothetical protein